MSDKNKYLGITILTSLVFIGYLTESEPRIFFGYAVSIWIVRLAWFIIAASNLLKYLKIKKAEKERS